MAIKLLEVELQARLRTSMLRTSQAFPLSIIKRLLLVEAVDFLEEEVCLGEAVLIPSEAIREVDEVASLRLVEAVNVAQGGDGGIGKRFVSTNFTFNAGIYNSSQNNRTRESSVAILPQWRMLEEIEFHRLAKLRLEVDEPEDLWVSTGDFTAFSLILYRRETYGRLFAYDKSYDRITTKTEKPLQLVDRIKYNTTTSDDPVIQQASTFSC